MYKFFKFIFILIILMIIKRLFIFYKFNDQKVIKKKEDYHIQNIKDYNNIPKQFGPIVYEDTIEFGIYRLHPFSHPNDLDFNLAKIEDNLSILDCGSGFLGTEKRLLEKYNNLNLHTVNKVNEKYRKKIIEKIKENNWENKIRQHFCDFKNMATRFEKQSFDRILFIESLGYSNNIAKVLSTCYNILKKNGIIYIRIITAPKTKSSFIKGNIQNIEKKIDCNLLYHENIIYYLQQAGFMNIKYSSIPLILSENYTYPFFIVPLLRYKLLNFSNMYTTLSLSETMYVASK